MDQKIAEAERSEADGFAARVENEFAWKVSLEEIQNRSYNLDIKNLHISE